MIFILMLVAIVVTLGLARLLVGRETRPGAMPVILGSLLPVLVTFGVPFVSVVFGGPSPGGRAWNEVATAVGLVLSVLIAGTCCLLTIRAARAGLPYGWPWLAATIVAAIPALLWAMTVALWAVV